MDPLVYILPDLHEMVFLHFTVADFQETTQVTAFWNEKLGESRKMMEKVKLKFDNPPTVNRFLDDVEGVTTRRYQNVYIDSLMLDFGFSKRILEYFFSSPETISSLETSFRQKLSEKDQKIFDSIDMSRLKRLKLKGLSEDFAWTLLSQCSSLTELHLIGSTFDTENIVKIIKISVLTSFLERNRTLKVLKLFPSFYEIFFDQDISEIAKFKLEGLQTRNTEGFGTKLESIERNFKKFLVKQSQTLERLEIYTCKPNVIEHIFSNMPALKDFRIQKPFTTEGLRLNPNPNLEALFIPRIEDPYDFRKILQNVPNLTLLFTLYLSRQKLDIINETLPALVTVFCCVRRRRLEDPTWKSVIRMTDRSYPCCGQMWKIEM